MSLRTYGKVSESKITITVALLKVIPVMHVTKCIDVKNVFYVFYLCHVFYVFNVFYFNNVFIIKNVGAIFIFCIFSFT